jgi:hypothetical protein
LEGFRSTIELRPLDEVAVNWEALYGVEGLGPFDEF